MNTLNKGDLAELAVAAKLAKLGKPILRPITSGTKYDLLIDHGENAYSRIQVKNGRLKGSFVEFNAYSLNKETLERKSYVGLIDYFGVYCAALDKVYLVPVEEVGSNFGRLNLNKHKLAKLDASDFEV